MKKDFIIIALLSLICISSNVVNTNNVKPIPPDKMFIKQYQSDVDAIEEMKKLFKNGWILKSFTPESNGQSHNRPTLIMEKY